MAIEICLVSYSRPERLPIIREQLKAQTRQDFNFNVWDNTVNNIGSVARFKLAKMTKGNPIIFIDDDESLDDDFVEYMMSVYDPKAVKSWFTRIFENESYWFSRMGSPGEEVDYCGTGGMILDRKIIDELEEIPPEFSKVEDLYLSYKAREKGLRLECIEPHIHIEVDGKDQYQKLGAYKENAFLLLRTKGWKLRNE